MNESIQGVAQDPVRSDPIGERIRKPAAVRAGEGRTEPREPAPAAGADDWPYIVAAFGVLGVLAAVTIFFLLRIQPHLALCVISIVMSGALGGVVFAVRDSRLVWPKVSAGEIHLGWVTDCLYGVAGAFAVFLVVPNFSEGAINGFREHVARGVPAASVPVEQKGGSSADLIEVIAVALVGGFAGRSVLKMASDGILRKQIEEVRQTVEAAHREVTQKVEETRQELGHQLEDANRDRAALALVVKQLNPDLPSPPAEELRQAISGASPDARAQIFDAAQHVFYRQREPQVASRVIPVFEALKDADPGCPTHKVIALLAEAYEAALDDRRALDNIEIAIRLRDTQDADGALAYAYYGDLRERLVGRLVSAEPVPSVAATEVAGSRK